MNTKTQGMKTPAAYGSVLKKPDCLFIGGHWVSPLSGHVASLISPIDGNVFSHVAHAGPSDVDAAVKAARYAFDKGPWPRMSPAERAPYIARLSQEISARADIMAGLQAAEMGALYHMALPAIPFFASAFDFYADLATKFQFVEKHQPAVGGVGYLVHEPVGVCAAIVPWNGPLMLAAWKLAPALLAGCTLILKASPEAPSTLIALAEAVEAADFPPGVVNVITADREVSELLVRHPDVDKVSFTGSTAAGRKIGAICADRLARCTLELGGKSPAILTDDYDIEKFAQQVAPAATLMSGQICAALTRIIVPRNKQDAVLEALSARLSAVKVGNPFDPSTGMGPLASATQKARVAGYIAKGVSEGARLVCGGEVPESLDPRFYLAPTVFGDVDNTSTIAREEIFGPVLSVIPADSEEHAIEIANANDYGLAAAVFTDDQDKAFSMARRLHSGTVSQSAYQSDFTIGFGGFKRSGIGREGGVPGLRAYLESKTILLDIDAGATGPRH